MKINNIKINSYGKLKNKEIELKNNLNLIYGNNESGKSTLLKFIINTFYGISKNKKGKELSDYDKYLPWEGEEFSGKIEYELDNKNKFEVFRDFKKKNPKIFDQDKNDISKEFNIDKAKGNEFFYDQTNIPEELFCTTIVANQQEVKLEKSEQNLLIQKIANLVGTGEDNVSYRIAMDRINRRQRDEVGSEKSREKPMNVLERKINELENEKKSLEQFKNLKYEIEENKNNLLEEISKLETENNFLQEIKILNENEKIEKEKIKIKEKLKNENLEKIKKVKEELEKIQNKNKKIKIQKNEEKNKLEKNKNKINKKLIIIFLILIIINIIQFILIKNNIFKYIFLLTVPTFLIFWYFYLKSQKNKIKIQEKNNKTEIEKINIEKINVENQINLLEKNNNNLEGEINNLKNKYNEKIKIEKEKIKNNYLNKISENQINLFLNLENINLEKEKIQNKLNDKKIELHTLDLDKENIEPKLDNLSKIEEELVNDNEKMSTLKNLNLSMNLAKETMQEAYEEMKNTITPKFTRNLSENINQITNGKYTNVRFSDQIGLIIELDNGSYEEASKMSIGTIDQLYLSLRLSMVEDLSQEKMPIILDESFAYYDTERLENVLKFLCNNFKNHQIILLTCTNREKEILDKINIEYNFINLDD